MNVCLRLKLGMPVLVFVLLSLGSGFASPPPAEEAGTWDHLMISAEKSLKSSNVSGAVRLCEEALAMAAQFGPADTRLSKSQVLRAKIYTWEKKNDLAEQTFKLAIISCEKAAGSNDLALVDPLTSLANFYSTGIPRNDEVLPLFLRILTIVEKAPERSNRDLIMWSRNVGLLYEQMGRYAEAEPLFQRAVALAEQNDPRWLPYELLTAAEFYRTWGKYEQAEALANRALAMREQLAKADDGVDAQMDMVACLDNLGATYLAWPKPEKAKVVYTRSLAIAQKFLAGDQADLAPHFANLAAAESILKRANSQSIPR